MSYAIRLVLLAFSAALMSTAAVALYRSLTRRRERRRRLYYLRAIVTRVRAVAGPDVNLPGTFATDPATFTAWLNERETIPAWIPQLAQAAYRVPPPPKPAASLRLLWGILLGIVALGAGAVVLLSTR